MLLDIDHLIFMAASIEVRIVNVALVVDGDAGCYATIGALDGSVKETLERVGADHNIALYDAQGGVGSECFLLSRLEHKKVVGGGMRGEIAEVDQAKTHLLRGLREDGCIFFRREVVVDGIAVRHADVAAEHGLDGLQRGSDRVLNGGDDVQFFHGKGVVE